MKNFGFPTVLFLIFLTLKLTGVLQWSWLWVFAPLWVSGLFTILFFSLYVWLHTGARKAETERREALDALVKSINRHRAG